VIALVTPGWTPGGPLSGTPDPSSASNPGDLFGTIASQAGTVFTSAGGAILLFMVGIWALLKGWAWYTAMFRKPRQLTLF
jgi:hypothetical protein